MRRLYEIDDLSTGYLELVDGVLSDGRKRSPRGQKTREVPNCTIVLADPRRSHPTGIGREYGKAIAAAEALSLIGGVSDPDLMLSVGSNFARFLDGGVLHGTYGPRVRGQLGNVVRRLEEDEDTRQAILQIWDPRFDQAGWVPRDLPCTLTLGFAIYDRKLEMSTTMRSNDLWWGLAHDFPMFTALQLTVADALRLEPGPYTHNAYSLHMYERDMDEVAKLQDAADTEPPILGGGMQTWPDGCESAADAIEVGASRARQILAGKPLAAMSEEEEWYDDVLDPHTEKVRRHREWLTGKNLFEPLK